MVAWLSPPIDTLEVNFNALVIRHNAAVGYAIRNYKGDVLLAGGKPFTLLSIPYAELLAAWLHVKETIMNLNATRIWLEGDSQIVVFSLSSQNDSTYANNTIIQDLRAWRMMCSFFFISHTHREANQLADCMARIVISAEF